MTVVEFWAKASGALTNHLQRAAVVGLSEEEQHENVSDFLTDMDALAYEWYNRTDCPGKPCGGCASEGTC